MGSYLEKPKIFNDKWKYAELPPIQERREKLDLTGLAAMGSCFARNFIRWLDHHHYSDRKQPWDILYNPFSILKELERLYVPIEWEKYILTEIDRFGKRRYRDPWRTWHVSPDVKSLKKQNELFDTQARKFVDNATGFLITLGLSEAWSPSDNPNLVLNQVPIGSIRLDKTSWSSRFASVPEVHHALTNLVSIIKENVSDNCPIIFTLSPIPLKYTASGLSTREANNISKSTLLVALQELVRNRPDVDYFPSYEIVQTLVERDSSKVWQADGRHITANVVDETSRRFLSTYGIDHTEQKTSNFWVPMVNEDGNIIGRLYADGTRKLTGQESSSLSGL